MALQVRRGTNAERLSITPLAGELIYVTDTKQLYVGDGTTVGGTTTIVGTIDSLLADTTPQLGGDLDLNNYNITGTGNINITGNITATGTITATGNINLGDGAGDDVISLNGVISGNLLPQTDTTWNIGAPTFQFKEAWISQLNVDNQITANRINASLISDDSTVVFDAITGTLDASALVGTFNGNLVGDVTGSVFGDDSSILIDGVKSRVTGIVETTNVNIANDGADVALLNISSSVVGATGCNDILFESYGGTRLAPTDVAVGNGVVDIIARGWHTGAGRGVASMRFRTDPLGSFDNPSTGLPGSILFSTFNNAGVQPLSNFTELDSQGRLNVGGTSVSNPSLPGRVRVVGGVSSTSFMLPGSLTTSERNALTPSVGMIIYNTDDNKFQGYQNTGGTTLEWVNLS